MNKHQIDCFQNIKLNFSWLISWKYQPKIVSVITTLYHPYYTPTHRVGAILQSPCPSVHTFVTDISAPAGRNDFIFDILLWHGDLYRVSPFQAYHTSTSCLQRELEFFMFAVIKTFVTDISASTGWNDLIFDIWLLHGDLYHVSPFQVYRTLLLLVMSVEIYTNLTQMNEWGYS